MASIGSDGSRHISHQNICFVAKGGFLKRPGSVYPRLSALNTLCGLSVFREHGSSHSAADFFKHCRVIRISSAIANKTNHWITLRFNDLARRIDSSWQISKQTIELIRTKSSGMIERGYEYQQNGPRAPSRPASKKSRSRSLSQQQSPPRPKPPARALTRPAFPLRSWPINSPLRPQQRVRPLRDSPPPLQKTSPTTQSSRTS